MLLPLTDSQCAAKFGRFKYVLDPKPGNPEHIIITGGWAEKNIGTVYMDQLGRRVSIHYAAMRPAMKMLAEWQAAGLLPLVHTFNGCWAPRLKRGRKMPSRHAWGTALDFNAREYPLGKPAAPDAPIRQLVPIAEANGFFWGGNFKSRPDPMHFEFVGLQETDRNKR